MAASGETPAAPKARPPPPPAGVRGVPLFVQRGGKPSVSVALNGSLYEEDDGRHKGRGQEIQIGKLSDGIRFVCDGKGTRMVLRWHANADLSLDLYDHKFKSGEKLCLWGYTPKRPDWAVAWRRNGDGTLSPYDDNGRVRPKLVVGANAVGGLELVPATDIAKRLVFLSARDATAILAKHRTQWDAERSQVEATMLRQAQRACSRDALAQLKRDGFAVLPGLIRAAFIFRALRNLNRALGIKSADPKRLKAESFAFDGALTDLFNKSPLPYVLQHLLDSKQPCFQGEAQVALRFPGDLCQGGGYGASPEHLEELRRDWHIDGLADNFIPGVTDHFGAVFNFDALVGIFLSEVKTPLSGELCCYPGSHTDLAAHAAKSGVLLKMYKHGVKALPTGKATDKVLSRLPVPIFGRPGDVIIANHMVAHYVAPNTSPHIRYMVYFRVKGPQFARKQKHYPKPLLHPWIHWCSDMDQRHVDDVKGPTIRTKYQTSKRNCEIETAMASIDYTSGGRKL